MYYAHWNGVHGWLMGCILITASNIRQIQAFRQHFCNPWIQNRCSQFISVHVESCTHSTVDVLIFCWFFKNCLFTLIFLMAWRVFLYMVEWWTSTRFFLCCFCYYFLSCPIFPLLVNFIMGEISKFCLGEFLLYVGKTEQFFLKKLCSSWYNCMHNHIQNSLHTYTLATQYWKGHEVTESCGQLPMPSVLYKIQNNNNLNTRNFGAFLNFHFS